MECPSCQREAPAGATFCGACGSRLAATAPAPSPRSYTPDYLTRRILTTRGAMEGERKQVTVLFVDVQGSVGLSDELDPEDLHDVMEGLFRIAADAVHRFEGTVNQYTGDGIMALFGAPIAHEDHAQHACFSALDLNEEVQRYSAQLQQARGISFAIRTGLSSGEVVVGKIGDDLRMDYTAQGFTVGLAARVQGLAEPGRILMTSPTARLAAGFVSVREVGHFPIKGVREPVEVFELLGPGPVRTRLELARSRGFSPFVGREAELDVLDRALDSAMDDRGSVVAIGGEAGVGKSRLCLEFLIRCGNYQQARRTLEGWRRAGVERGPEMEALEEALVRVVSTPQVPFRGSQFT